MAVAVESCLQAKPLSHVAVAEAQVFWIHLNPDFHQSVLVQDVVAALPQQLFNPLSVLVDVAQLPVVVGSTK